MDIVLAEDECSTSVVDDLSKRFKKILKKEPEQIYLVLDDNEQTLMHIVKLNDVYHVIDDQVLGKYQTIGAAVDSAVFIAGGGGERIYTAQELFEVASHRIFKTQSKAYIDNVLDQVQGALSRRECKLSEYKIDLSTCTLFELDGVITYGVLKSEHFNAIIDFNDNSINFYTAQ
jgi:hypothetical protein